MGTFVHREMAESACAIGGWQPDSWRERDSAGRSHDSSHAIDNFEFEQTVRYARGWNKNST
jgi:hypothetical protein